MKRKIFLITGYAFSMIIGSIQPSYSADTSRLINSKTFHLKLSNECKSYYGSNHCWFSSTPAVTDDMIYVSGYNGYLFAVSKKTGQIIWQYATYNAGDEYARAFSAVVSNESVFIGNRTVYALSKTNGMPIWTHSPVASGSRLVLENDTLYFSEGSFINALDTKTGMSKLKYPGDRYNSYITPVVKDGSVFVAMFPDSKYKASKFFAFDQITSAIKWEFEGEGTEHVYSASCVANGNVYFGSQKTVYSMGSKHHFYALDQNSGKIKWSYGSYIGFTSAPYCDQNNVFIGEEGAHFYAFDSKNGQIKWEFVAIDESPRSYDFNASPNVHNGVVFVGNDNHYLYALNAETGILKWKFKADGEIMSKPVISDGIVYFTTGAGSLYAVNEETGQL